jgi:hypothetical protein
MGWCVVNCTGQLASEHFYADDNRVRPTKADPSSSNVRMHAPPAEAEIASGKADETGLGLKAWDRTWHVCISFRLRSLLRDSIHKRVRGHIQLRVCMHALPTFVPVQSYEQAVNCTHVSVCSVEQYSDMLRSLRAYGVVATAVRICV